MNFNDSTLANKAFAEMDIPSCKNPDDFKIVYYSKTMFEKGYAFDMSKEDFIEKVSENFDIMLTDTCIELFPYSTVTNGGGKLLRLHGPLHKEFIENIIFSRYLGNRSMVFLGKDHAAVVEKKKLIFNRGLLKNIVVPTRKVDGVFHFEDVVRVNTDEYGCLEFRFATNEMARNFADSFRF